MDPNQELQINSEGFVEKQVQILNRYGFHGRPTTMFVKLANTFSSDISVNRSKEDSSEMVNAKSAIAILSLGIEYGVKLLLRAKGEDAKEAISALSALINDKFEEA